MTVRGAYAVAVVVRIVIPAGYPDLAQYGHLHGICLVRDGRPHKSVSTVGSGDAAPRSSRTVQIRGLIRM